MNGELTHLILTAAVGAALLALAAFVAVGGRRTLHIARGLGLLGLLLALFAGTAVESLSIPLADAAPYNELFLGANDLHIQALMEDPDLRTRYNVDSRLRYIPLGSPRVINLDAPYTLDVGPIRTLDFTEAQHTERVTYPKGVEPLGLSNDPRDLRAEVGGLYEKARALTGPAPSQERADFARTSSVGFIAIGLVGLVAGLLPLLIRLWALLGDGLRLLRATAQRGYRGARTRAVRAGLPALAQWHFADARGFGAMATSGLLALLLGLLLGVLREEETRRAAHETFAAARHQLVEGGQLEIKGPSR